MKKSKIMVKIGDIFQMPLDARTVGYGQVVHETKAGAMFVCLFNITSGDDQKIDLEKALKTEIVVAANTFISFIQNGKWPLVGQATPVLGITDLPKYRVLFRGVNVVEDFEGKKNRPLNSNEEKILEQRSYLDCALLEKIYKQNLGLTEIDKERSEFKYEYILKCKKIKV